jgi:SAM-dependent methyltransferase
MSLGNALPQPVDASQRVSVVERSRPSDAPARALSAIVREAETNRLVGAAGMRAACALTLYGEHRIAERVARSVSAHVLQAGLSGISLLERAWLTTGVYSFQGTIPDAPATIRAIADTMVEEAISRARRNQAHGLAALVALASAREYLASRHTVVVDQLTRTIAELKKRWRPRLWAFSPEDLAALTSADPVVAAHALSTFLPFNRSDRLEWAACAYRLGRRERADRALARFEAQATSADFECPLLASRYLVANRWRVRKFFDAIAPELPQGVAVSDGRAQAVIGCVRAGDRVLEVGCGKGRFLRAAREAVPSATYVGIDLSDVLLAAAPQSIMRVSGTLESIPCREQCFDVVFSVEAIEHSANWRACVEEMLRVTRPGGYVIIIDKPHAAWGWLPCPPWERWPEDADLVPILRDQCDEVESLPVSYDGMPADGRIIAWRGRKKS